jgi:hypothetical protein
MGWSAGRLSLVRILFPLEDSTVRSIAFAVALGLCAAGLWADDKTSDDTPAAAAARKLLQKKLKDVGFKETRLRDALDEISDEIKGLRFRVDTKGGVSNNQTVNYAGKDVTVADALDAMFKKNDLGYVVISAKNTAYDGTVLIKKGKERGFPAKDEKK